APGTFLVGQENRGGTDAARGIGFRLLQEKRVGLEGVKRGGSWRALGENPGGLILGWHSEAQGRRQFSCKGPGIAGDIRLRPRRCVGGDAGGEGRRVESGAWRKSVGPCR